MLTLYPKIFKKNFNILINHANSIKQSESLQSRDSLIDNDSFYKHYFIKSEP